MAVKKDYSLVKKAIWRFGRVFVVAFVGAVVAIQPSEDWREWVFLAAMSGFSAALAAVGKALREFVASGDYKNLIHKLPF